MSDKVLGGGSGILMAVMAGAVVGAGAALLFAPRSGKDTRDWLAHRTRKLTEQTTDALAKGKEAILQAAIALGKDVADATSPNERPLYVRPGVPPVRR